MPIPITFLFSSSSYIFAWMVRFINIYTLLLLVTFKSQAQIGFNEIAEQYSVNDSTDIGFLGAGVSFCDFNGDGKDDLTVCTGYGEELKFYLNNGSGFTQLNPPPILNTSEVKQVNWVDIDNDGDKDFYISVYNGESKLYLNNSGLGFTDITSSSGISVNYLEAFGSTWGDINNDGYLDLFIAIRDPQSTCILYQNNGDNTFTDITFSSGLGVLDDIAFCSVFFDFDNDNDQDLYIINDKVFSQNKLYENDGSGLFTDISTSSGVGVWIDAMTGTIGDYNCDGLFDIYVSNTTDGNIFLNNNGDGTFTDITGVTGTGFYGTAWSCQFLDVDNDTDLDLYVSGDNDVFGTLSSALYENDGTGVYSIPTVIGLESDTLNSQGNAIGDINNDGFPDIYVTNAYGDKNFLWENIGNTNNWLKILLEGRVSNRDGVGSKIKIYSNGKYQYNYINIGEGYLSQNSFNEFFGLGSATNADSVIVFWPSGFNDTLLNIPANSSLNIIEGQSAPINTQILTNDSILCGNELSSIWLADPSNTVLWSTGSSNDTIVVTEGMYSAIVTNPYGFSAQTDTIYLLQDNLSVELLVEDNLCGLESNGQIEAVVQSEFSYEITWSTGDTLSIISDLSGGMYTLSIVDSVGCIFEDTAWIISNPPLFIQYVSSNFSDTEFGSISLYPFGGTPPYNYYLNGNLVNNQIDSLYPGTYEVLIIDDNGCEASDTIFIHDNSTTGVFNGSEFDCIVSYANGILTTCTNSISSIISIRVFSPEGKVISNFLPKDIVNSCTCAEIDLESGVYFFEIQTLNSSLLKGLIVE